MSDLYTLQRQSQSDEGTFGELRDESGNHLCYTCELPWNNNMAGASCIPSGKYTCIPHNGDEWKNVWEVSNVPGHSAILIHAGNTIKDTKGCILVGKSEGWLGSQLAVMNSLSALNELRIRLPQTFELSIIDVHL